MNNEQNASKTTNYIIPLSDPEADIETAGGKGASLARLATAGLPVSGGFIVTTEAYRQFVTKNGLEAEIFQALKNKDIGQPSSQEEVSSRIHVRFSAAEIPPEIARMIILAYADIPGRNPAVAVRSSATAEDLPEASFAGQQETYLNVRGPDAILDAIKKCWASLWSARAIGYRYRQGISPKSVAIAAVIQLLVPAEAAGILFTANPVTGDRNQAVLSASWGLGAAVVGGLVTPDSMIIDKESGRMMDRTTADKKVMTVQTDMGTKEQPVPESLRWIPVLRDEEAVELTRLGVKIEQLYNTPMDIEWARHDGLFTILQARPITALPPVPVHPAKPIRPLSLSMGTKALDSYGWNDSLSSDYLWSNVNFGEAISDVMTPLTWSVVRFTLDDWVFVPGIPMVGNIGGYPYLNISVLASLFYAMRRSRHDLLNELEATVYLPMPEEMEIPAFPLSRWKLLSSLFSSMQVRRKQWRGVRALGLYLVTNPSWFQQMRERIQVEREKVGLSSLFQREIKPHIKKGVWSVLGTASHSANYTIRLRRDLTELVGPDDANILIANLGNRSMPLASLGPVIGLAQVVRGEMSREIYLEQYGHRGPHEFELSHPHPAEDPEWFDREIAINRQSPVDVVALLQKQQETFDSAWRRLQSRYPRRAKAIGRRIAESARRARLREMARSEYVRDRWTLRLFALRAGELSGLGDDVFFLMLEEVLDLLAGNKTAIRSIPDRRKIYLQYKSLPPYPSLIRGKFDPFEWAANPQRRSDIFDGQPTHMPTASGREGTKIITGSPGSAGRVEGTVRCLRSHEEGAQLQLGEILIAVQTDIAWTVLFPRAAAVVTDVGAPLSHAAIVARELGIPAVVGCGNATQRLKTGDRVRVDGGRGMVEILERMK